MSIDVRVQVPSFAPRRRKLHIACGDFFTKVTGALIPLRLLFRKRQCLRAPPVAEAVSRDWRSGRICPCRRPHSTDSGTARGRNAAAPSLLACKRAHNAPACYQPFSGTRGFKFPFEKISEIYFVLLLHVGMSYARSDFLFYKKSINRFTVPPLWQKVTLAANLLRVWQTSFFAGVCFIRNTAWENFYDFRLHGSFGFYFRRFGKKAKGAAYLLKKRSNEAMFHRILHDSFGRNCYNDIKK